MKIKKEMNDKLTIVYIDNKKIYFSYETPVAFWNGKELFVSENEWGSTTGKHLNAIDGGNKFNRIPYVDLMDILLSYTLINTNGVK